MRLAFFLFALLCSTLPAHAAKTILVMGDSLSAGYGIRPEQAWPALLGVPLVPGWITPGIPVVLLFKYLWKRPSA